MHSSEWIDSLALEDPGPFRRRAAPAAVILLSRSTCDMGGPIRYSAWAVLVLVLGCSRPPSSVSAAGSPVGGNPAAVLVQPDPGERHLRNSRQLTFGGNNAEAYFSPDGRAADLPAAGEPRERLRSAVRDERGRQRPAARLERPGPHHLRLLLRRRPPHPLQLHLRALARVPAAARPVAGLRLAARALRDLQRASRRLGSRAGSPGTTPTTPRPPCRPTGSGWCSPAPATATSSSTR